MQLTRMTCLTVCVSFAGRCATASLGLPRSGTPALSAAFRLALGGQRGSFRCVKAVKTLRWSSAACVGGTTRWRNSACGTCSEPCADAATRQPRSLPPNRAAQALWSAVQRSLRSPRTRLANAQLPFYACGDNGDHLGGIRQTCRNGPSVWSSRAGLRSTAGPRPLRKRRPFGRF